MRMRNSRNFIRLPQYQKLTLPPAEPTFSQSDEHKQMVQLTSVVELHMNVANNINGMLLGINRQQLPVLLMLLTEFLANLTGS
ncbi:hypothetical protein ACLKA7_016648 [Drosophila subpalustris]